MSPSATPATQSEGRCHQVPRLPRKVKVDVAKCHACHANNRGDNGVNWEPSAPPEPAQCHKCHACHAKCRSMSPSATPATQSEGRCRQVPRLPRKQPRRCRQVPRLSRKVQVDVAKCHACHANSRGDHGAQAHHQSQPSAISATQSGGRCRQVPRLPHKVTVHVAKCYTCHAK